MISEGCRRVYICKVERERDRECASQIPEKTRSNCSEEADQLEATLARLNKLTCQIIFPDPWQLNQLFSPLHGGRVRVSWSSEAAAG